VARTGRRPGTSSSREEILAAARSRFATDGYDGATIRGIAASAGVDPGLVRHYFGSKEHLFVESMEFPVDPAVMVKQLIGPGLDGAGERLVRFFLETWDAPDAPFVALLRSVTTNEQAAEMLRQFLTREVVGRVAASLDLDRPELRASLAASHLVGLAFLRYVVRLEPVASADRETLVAQVGPTIQRYFTADDGPWQ
jgi:AcrR family transcriptional regulator